MLGYTLSCLGIHYVETQAHVFTGVLVLLIDD